MKWFSRCIILRLSLGFFENLILGHHSSSGQSRTTSLRLAKLPRQNLASRL